MKRIIYKNQDNSVSMLISASEALSFATIEQIAEKDRYKNNNSKEAKKFKENKDVK